MDDEKLERLLTGMGDAMGVALGQALQSTFGEEAVRQRREAAEEEERERDLAAEQQQQIEWAMERARQRQKQRASSLLTEVRWFSHAAYHSTLEALKSDERMSGSVNYAERYAAFKRIRKSDELLRRIDQTISVAERIIERASRVDPEAAVNEKAAQYKQRMEQLGMVAVGSAKRHDGGKDDDERLWYEHERLLAENSDQAAVPLEKAMLAAYLGVLGSAALESVEVAGGPTPEEENDALVEKAIEAAERAADEVVERNANHVEGFRIFEHPLQDFDGTIVAECRYDARELERLAKQVRISFQTYAQCIRDNGLFSAFPDGSKYGEGISWAYIHPLWRGIDDSEQASEGCGIPDVVEDQKEDDPTHAIARMMQFNSKKYWGMLDDDFSEHIDAFWYGFKKLMEFVNGLFDIDLSSYSSYVQGIRREIEATADLIGLRINDVQLKELSEQIAELKKRIGGIA